METPNYLTFKEHLFQVWFNQYTLVIILILIKSYFFKNSLLSSIDEIQIYAATSMQHINDFNDKMASLPYTYSQVINIFIQQNINTLKHQALNLILLSINMVLGIIKFLISIFFGTFICLFDGLVNGFIDFALDIVQDILQEVGTVIKAATTIIATSLRKLGDFVDDISSGINSISKFFTNNDIVNATSLISNINGTITNLNGFSLPSSIYDDINGLKDTIPSFDDIEDEVIDELESPLSDLIEGFNRSQNFQDAYTNISMPVVKSTKLDQSKLDKAFKDIKNDINDTFIIILIALIILSVSLIIGLAIKEYFAWKRKYQFYIAVKNQPIDDFRFLNLLNWFSSTFIYYCKSFFGVSDKTLWLISFITSTYSLALLGIVIAGFFTILLQYCLFRVFSIAMNKLPLVSASNDISKALVANTDTFINNTNEYIQLQQQNLNDELFGSITNTTARFSSIINSMVIGLNETLVDPFSSTPFAAPLGTVVYCIITRKLIMVEQGLEWITDNLNIELPELPDEFKDEFNNMMMSQVNSSSLDISPYIDKTVSSYKKSLLIECYIFSAFFGLWVLQLLIGIGYNFYRRQRYRQIGYPKPLTVREKLDYEYPFQNIK